MLLSIKKKFMDISSSSYDKLPEKYMLGFYYPADFEYDDDGSKYPQNPEFNGYSEMILDLKDNCEYAIDSFHKDLSCTLLYVKNIVIVTPPTNSIGIKNLARRLSMSNKEIEYYSSYFGRSSNRERGNREIYSNNQYSITGRKAILLDDVVTTGKTMEKW
jgi:phosphoribosylpyrophosphate synthetase